MELNGGYQEIALTADRKFSTFLPTKIVPSMKYNEVFCGPGGMRQEVEMLADSGTTFTSASNKIVIPIRSQGIIDWKHACIEFNASAVVTGGTAGTFYFTNGIWNLFSRVKVVCNGSIIFDQPFKNLWRSTQYTFCRAPSIDASIGDACWGVSSSANRIARVGGYNYMIPLDIPFLVSEEVPFKSVTNFQIELELAPDNSVICYGTQVGGTPKYTINNPRIRVQEVFYQPDLMQAFDAMKAIMYPFTTYKVAQVNVPSGSNTNQINIPIKVQGVKRIFAFMKTASDIGNPAVADVWTDLFRYANATDVQLKVDNYYYPPQPIKLGGAVGGQEGYLSLFRGMDRYESYSDIIERRNNGETGYLSVNDFPITYSDFTSNKFMTCIDLKTFAEHSEQALTKFDTTPGNTTIQLNLNFQAGSPTSNSVIYIVVVHSSLIIQYSNGTFTLIE